jgi:hypothetical protein
MRAAFGRDFWGPASAFRFVRSRWLQAGFFGFAYRLAHLRASRSFVVPALAALFVLV